MAWPNCQSMQPLVVVIVVKGSDFDFSAGYLAQFQYARS